MWVFESDLLNCERINLVVLHHLDYGKLLWQPWETSVATVNKIDNPSQKFSEARPCNSLSSPQDWPLMVTLTSSSNYFPLTHSITLATQPSLLLHEFIRNFPASVICT